MGNHQSSAPSTTPRLPRHPYRRRRRGWRSPLTTKKTPPTKVAETPGMVLKRIDERNGRFLVRRTEDLKVLVAADEGRRLGATHLEIKGFFLDGHQDQLTSLMSALPNLKAINFNWSYWEYRHRQNIPIDGLVHSLKMMNASLSEDVLIHVDLSRNELNDRDVMKLSEPGVLPTMLTSLRLSRHLFGLDGAKHVLRAVAKLPKLTTLDIGQDCYSPIPIVCTRAKLTSLTLEELRIGDRGIVALCKEGVLPDTLRVLNLSKCGIGEEGAESLSRVHLPLLEELNLSGNDIGRLGIECLVRSELPRSLKRLDLTGCDIGHRGAELLVEYANSFAGLEFLFLHGNGIRFHSEIGDLWLAFPGTEFPDLEEERFRHPYGCNPDSDPDYYEKCQAWESEHNEEEERFNNARRLRKMEIKEEAENRSIIEDTTSQLVAGTK